jgi:hypothetical protein
MICCPEPFRLPKGLSEKKCRIWLVLLAAGCVARSLQTAAGMRLARALAIDQNSCTISRH